MARHRLASYRYYGLSLQMPTSELPGRVPRTPHLRFARSTLNGFGATEVDLTLRRQFKIYERFSLRARADFFNLLNHPYFGPPTNYMTSPSSARLPDARLLARRRRQERRPQSPLPDRRPPLGAVGADASILRRGRARKPISACLRPAGSWIDNLAMFGRTPFKPNSSLRPSAWFPTRVGSPWALPSKTPVPLAIGCRRP